MCHFAHIHAPRLVAFTLALSLLGSGEADAKPNSRTPSTPAQPSQDPAVPIDASRIRAHELRPAHVIDARTLDEIETPSRVRLRRMPRFPATPKLDTGKFAAAIHGALKDSTRGYVMQLRRNGVPEVTLVWDWAQTPTDGSAGWTVDTPMHIASVSKLVTAIVMTKLLDEQGLGVDTKIGPYLPSYWTVGNNVADITFRDLLNHTSGFSTNASDGSFPIMKAEVMGGVMANAGFDYENVNFSICRVLGAVMTGAVDRDKVWDSASNDVIWDLIAVDWFVAYAQAKVFGPAGVSNVSMTAGGNARAYQGKSDEQGWDSGDLTSQLGGAGFRLSVNQLLDVLATFRRGGKIVSSDVARQALDAQLGIDQVFLTPAGRIYNKNGGWGDDAGNTEQAVAYLFPEQMEVVVMVNSPIGAGESLRETVRLAYLNSLK